MNKLTKTCFYYLMASLLVVISARYIHLMLVYLDTFYVYINLMIAPIFNHSGWGKVVHHMIVLILIPLLLVGIPGLIYRLIKHQTLPYFIHLLWAVWLVLVLSTIMIH